MAGNVAELGKANKVLPLAMQFDLTYTVEPFESWRVCAAFGVCTVEAIERSFGARLIIDPPEGARRLIRSFRGRVGQGSG